MLAVDESVEGSPPSAMRASAMRARPIQARPGRVRLHVTLFLVFIGVLASAPLWTTNNYQWGILNQAMVFVVFAAGFYFVFGMSGQFNFAHGGFFAIGAVVSAKAAGENHFWLGFVAAIVVCVALGALFRFALRKVNAIYFAIATFALNGIALVVVQSWTWLSGGFAGLSGLAVPTFFGRALPTPDNVYWLYAAMAAVAVGLGVLLELSPLRRYVLVARDNRGILKTLGVSASRIELIMFALGCAFAGAAGSMYAHMIGFLSGFSFSETISLNVFLMVIMGGVSVVWGAVIGAYLLTWLPELLRGLAEHAALVYAALLVGVLLLVPKGITGVLERAWKVVRRA
ncbi:branched-chain amino acid ABC transporter permease [Rhodococcus sp. IEGM 1366]|uniref:branched-chain amino acid ABC transporter permease n=1 Tax=Rhodococcus sp. IEGM 1366 TaxID=3082223 RepID=UPI002953F8A0|nr:branched-chain amino acid ABC transporter permease [Rhodococcus sp. IEGM 1366]MDV8071000.1 branched-chain amino acid ABC transporter permease [Rhodococcus sp. IEGM 1366]